MQRRNALVSLAGLGAASLLPSPGVAAVPTPFVPVEPAQRKRGLYLNSGTLLDSEKLEGFLRLSTAFGVDTFIVDLWNG
ncbi:MAG: hypothetical protein MK135_16350, partial [Polyangiaceae bacterium]|nr:hypothetical protein [Polyangiaceae bacterium]